MRFGILVAPGLVRGKSERVAFKRRRFETILQRPADLAGASTLKTRLLDFSPGEQFAKSFYGPAYPQDAVAAAEISCIVDRLIEAVQFAKPEYDINRQGAGQIGKRTPSLWCGPFGAPKDGFRASRMSPLRLTINR